MPQMGDRKRVRTLLAGPCSPVRRLHGIIVQRRIEYDKQAFFAVITAISDFLPIYFGVGEHGFSYVP